MSEMNSNSNTNNQPFFYCKFAEKRQCHNCCIETQMMLTEDDIRRIEHLGYKKEDFSKEEDGFIILRNIDSHCFFLKDGKCSIYNNRPLGCRYYPIILDLDAEELIIDKDCPFHNHFSIEDYSYLFKHVFKLTIQLLKEKEDRTKKSKKNSPY